MSSKITIDPYYLAHHGILGQKWGIRRYQNSDGTLTEAGKKRYRAEDVESITDRKGLQRRLNDLDKAMARNTADVAYRVNKMVSTRNKTKKVEHERKALVATANINRGKKEIEKLIEKNQLNYDISSKNTIRNATKGRDILEGLGYTVALNALSIPISKVAGGALGLHGGSTAIGAVISVNTAKGKKYKVKEKKEEESSESKQKESGSGKKYNMDFLEAIQNKKLITQSGAKAEQKLDSEYKKYLSDPQKYWKEERHKLKDDDGLD